MRALPNQMSERVTRVGSRPWQACPLKANCQTFSIPISSSVGCQKRSFLRGAASAGCLGPFSHSSLRWLSEGATPPDLAKAAFTLHLLFKTRIAALTSLPQT
jgi:hypothetical protein